MLCLLMKSSHAVQRSKFFKLLNNYFWVVSLNRAVFKCFWNSLMMGCSRRSADADEDRLFHATGTGPQFENPLSPVVLLFVLLAPWAVQLKPTWDVHGQERHELEHIVWTSSRVPIHADLCSLDQDAQLVPIRDSMWKSEPCSAASLPSELTHSDGQVTKGRAEPPHSIQTGVAWTYILAVQLHCCSGLSDYGLGREQGHEQHRRPLFGAQFVAVWGGRNRCPPTCPRVRPWLLLEPR